jgi:hypothetical protein
LKRLFKVFFISVGLALLAMLALGIAIHAYQKPIIRRLIAEANKQVGTPVKIGHIEINWWADFPRLAILAKEVEVEDTHEENNPLFTAKRISFSLDLADLWHGRYVIERISVYQSHTFIKRNTQGEGNFNIFKKNKDSTSLAFRLNRITLREASVDYLDESAGQDHRFFSEKLIATLESKGNVYYIRADGTVTIGQIGVEKNLFFEDREFELQASLAYDDAAGRLQIDPSVLAQQNAQFLVAGACLLRNENHIDLSVQGRNATLQTLLTFLPVSAAKQLAQYESEGQVYFDATLKGPLRGKRGPALQVQFGWNNARFFHPAYQVRLEKASLQGALAVPKTNDLSTATLKLSGVSGQLNGQEVRADLTLKNFVNPLADVSLTGTFDAQFINSVYAAGPLENLSGHLIAAITYQGPAGNWNKLAPPKNVQGSVEFRNVSFGYKPLNMPLHQLNGLVQFTRQDVALSNFSGFLAAGDFHVNGLLRNIVNHIANARAPLAAEVEWRSRRLDLENLLSFFGKDGRNASLQIPPEWTLSANCQVDHLVYGRFRARALAGDLQIRNQLVATRNVQMKTLGGEVAFNGIADTQPPGAAGVVGGLRLANVHLDSLFYVFADFGQTFIQSRHLKGRVQADVSLEFSLNEALTLAPESLIADVTATIRQGELNHFEPMKKLNRYLDDEGLSQLRFADLSNDIHIENQTVYIPQMEIRSNVTTIQLSGTHTFGQQIDYRIAAPLRSKKKIDPDEAFGAIEESKGQSRIFLKITGTADRYEVSYDKTALKQKVAGDLKQEVKELKDAFRLKGKQKKKELELSEEEFDWN